MALLESTVSDDFHLSIAVQLALGRFQQFHSDFIKRRRQSQSHALGNLTALQLDSDVYRALKSQAIRQGIPDGCDKECLDAYPLRLTTALAQSTARL